LSTQKHRVIVDILGKSGQNVQEGFLTVLLSLPPRSEDILFQDDEEVILFQDDEYACDRSPNAAERFIANAKAEARKQGAEFEVYFDLDEEFTEIAANDES